MALPPLSSRPAAPVAQLNKPTEASQTAAVKAAFEAFVQKDRGSASNSNIFRGEKNAVSLPVSARAAYRQYEHTSRAGMINDGPPFKKVAVLNGERIFIVGGDISDTGSQIGFYNAAGKLLAMAYSGQGEHPNAAGVDWGS